MKNFIQFALVGFLAVALTGCFDTDLITGDIKVDIGIDPFNAIVSTGVMRKLNDVQTKNITITGTNGSKIVTLTLTEVGGDTTTNCLSMGNYSYNDISQNAQLLYGIDGETYSNVISCTATISECDGEEKFISGTFEGVLVSSSGDTLSFSNGSFEEVGFTIQ